MLKLLFLFNRLCKDSIYYIINSIPFKNIFKIKNIWKTTSILLLSLILLPLEVMAEGQNPENVRFVPTNQFETLRNENRGNKQSRHNLKSQTMQVEDQEPQKQTNPKTQTDTD